MDSFNEFVRTFNHRIWNTSPLELIISACTTFFQILISRFLYVHSFYGDHEIYNTVCRKWHVYSKAHSVFAVFLHYVWEFNFDCFTLSILKSHIIDTIHIFKTETGWCSWQFLVVSFQYKKMEILECRYWSNTVMPWLISDGSYYHDI